MKFSPELEKSFTARLSTHNRMSDWGGKPAFGLLPLSAHKQNKEIPSMAVLALFIETIDGIAYFAIAVRGFFQNLHKKLDKPQLIVLKYMLIQIRV
jgi:hypothetical protein